MLLQALALAAAITTPPGPTTSSTNVAPVQVQAPPAQDDADKIVCKYTEITGSRFKKKVCMTKAQMALQEQENERMERERDHMTGMQAGRTSAFDGR